MFGVPDETMGEEICVWARLADGEEMSDSELRAICNAELDSFKTPKFIKFVSTFPTVSGKVEKDKMVDAMISEMHFVVSLQTSV